MGVLRSRNSSSTGILGYKFHRVDVFLIKAGTNWQGARKSLDIYVLFKRSSPNHIEGGIFSQSIAEQTTLTGSFNITYVRGVNTRNGSIHIIK